MLNYGTLAGLLVGLPTFGSFVILGENHPGGTAGMALGYSIMLLGLSMVFLAIKRRRDELGGVIRFLPAFGLGLAISLVASAFLCDRVGGGAGGDRDRLYWRLHRIGDRREARGRRQRRGDRAILGRDDGVQGRLC
jgi:hypothetical protein